MSLEKWGGWPFFVGIEGGCHKILLSFLNLIYKSGRWFAAFSPAFNWIFRNLDIHHSVSCPRPCRDIRDSTALIIPTPP